MSTSTAGLVLAAGRGSRMGRPKALVVDPDGTPWLTLAIEALRAGGCPTVRVVLGAGAARAATLMRPDPAVETVVASRWREGLSASLDAGLSPDGAFAAADAAVVCLVDLPALPWQAVARVREHAGAGALVQATYGGRRGHPVALGREHWAAVRAQLSGDRGAGAYLRAHGARLVECGDLWDGADVDRGQAGRAPGR